MSEGLKDGVVPAQLPRFPLRGEGWVGGCRLILEALTCLPSEVACLGLPASFSGVLASAPQLGGGGGGFVPVGSAISPRRTGTTHPNTRCESRQSYFMGNSETAGMSIPVRKLTPAFPLCQQL